MTDDSREPSLADLARAQAARRAEDEARRRASDEEAKMETAKRREQWNALVVSARDFVNAANAELAGTGAQVEFEETKDELKSFRFGSLKIALRREAGKHKLEAIEFRCSTVGFIDYDIFLPGKDKKTQQIYLEDVEGQEINREIRKFLTEAFSA